MRTVFDTFYGLVFDPLRTFVPLESSLTIALSHLFRALFNMLRAFPQICITPSLYWHEQTGDDSHQRSR